MAGLAIASGALSREVLLPCSLTCRAVAVHMNFKGLCVRSLSLASLVGGELLLTNLYLHNATLVDPNAGDINKAFLPVALDVTGGPAVRLVDVVVAVQPQQLEQYLEFLRGVPEAAVWTVRGKCCGSGSSGAKYGSGGRIYWGRGGGCSGQVY
jgi:hypothetical protein